MTFRSPIKFSKKKKPFFLAFKSSIILILWLNNVSDRDDYLVKLKCLKKKVQNFYFSKSPMAHKTRSHEKYLKTTYYYFISTSFRPKKIENYSEIVIYNYMLKKFLVKISTNLILVKSFKIPLKFNYKSY